MKSTMKHEHNGGKNPPVQTISTIQNSQDYSEKILQDKKVWDTPAPLLFA